MTARWWKSLADDPRAMRKLAVHKIDDAGNDCVDVNCPHTLLVAPCCGRHSRADAILDLRGLVTVIRGGNHRAAKDHVFACHECVHIMILDPKNNWTWSSFYRALGADADTIRAHRARELQQEEERQANDADREALRNGKIPVGHNPQASYEKHHAALASGVRELPGTEAPDGYVKA